MINNNNDSSNNPTQPNPSSSRQNKFHNDQVRPKNNGFVNKNTKPKKMRLKLLPNSTKKMGVAGIHNGARCQATIGHNLVWWCSETPCHCSFLPLSPTLPPHSFLLLLLLSSGSQLSLCLPLFTSQLHNRL